jgi:hypothetical protein
VLDPQGDTAGAGLGGEDGSTPYWQEARPLYTRDMPGGGYVRVELVVSDRGNIAHERVAGRVIIEPRDPSPRRDDKAPLVVEQVEGEDENMVVAELFRIARDNAAIARRVLRQRQTRRAD